MGSEKAKLRVAIGILSLMGALVIWTAFDSSVHIPEGFYPVAGLAAGFYFSKAGDGRPHDDDKKPEPPDTPEQVETAARD